MSEQPDRLFREKLENFQVPVSSNAWNRVEEQLNKKNNTFQWWMVAASVILITSVGIVIYSQYTPTPTTISEKTKTPVEIKEPVIKQSPVTNDSSALKTKLRPEPEIKNSVASVKKNNIQHNSKKQKSQEAKPELPLPQEDIVEEITIAINTTSEVVDELPSNQIHVEETTSVANETSSAQKGIIIIYTIDEVNEKYLNKKSLAEATSDEKKSSTLKKLLDKAYDLKNNEDPFADLREKKNEILALNFKSEKQRSQNK